MKWKKLGLVYCPDGRLAWMKSHASVPFAEPLGRDLFRVYFSSRDSQNRSHVGFVDLDLNQPRKVLNLSRKPVLSPGKLGSFDEDGAMLSWITARGGRRYLYYIGWNLGKSVPFRNAIGLATRRATSRGPFQKPFAGPLLDRSVYDPCFVASCCVLPDRGLWRMWYLSCVQWQKTAQGLRHRYHLKYAQSRDGLHWERDGRVCIDFKNKAEYAISRPSVLKEDSGYKMWYSHRGGKYRIGYAESRNGIQWFRKDGEVGIGTSTSGWDSQMIEYPHVFDHQGQRFMLYNGNGYGKTGFGLAVLER